MGIKQDVEASLSDWPITKIDSQPTEETVSKLETETTEMCASVPTTNGGGQHGHAGMIVERSLYITFSVGNTPFVTPTNPGPYPTTVSADAATREKEVAEHKAKYNEFETYLGVESATRKKIVSAIDPEWLEAIRHPQMGFSHLSPRQLLDHLRSVSSDLDYSDVTHLMQELARPWDLNEKLSLKLPATTAPNSYLQRRTSTQCPRYALH